VPSLVGIEVPVVIVSREEESVVYSNSSLGLRRPSEYRLKRETCSQFVVLRMSTSQGESATQEQQFTVTYTVDKNFFFLLCPCWLLFLFTRSCHKKAIVLGKSGTETGSSYTHETRMLEKQLSALLVEYLNQFITGINDEQLSVSLWSGKVVLNDVHLKDDLLTEGLLEVLATKAMQQGGVGAQDMLPALTLTKGLIGSLEIHIPWSTLESEPVLVEVSNVEIVAVPWRKNDGSVVEVPITAGGARGGGRDATSTTVGSLAASKLEQHLKNRKQVGLRAFQGIRDKVLESLFTAASASSAAAGGRAGALSPAVEGGSDAHKKGSKTLQGNRSNRSSRGSSIYNNNNKTNQPTKLWAVVHLLKTPVCRGRSSTAKTSTIWRKGMRTMRVSSTTLATRPT
jgi:hypothetical protein